MRSECGEENLYKSDLMAWRDICDNTSSRHLHPFPRSVPLKQGLISTAIVCESSPTRALATCTAQTPLHPRLRTRSQRLLISLVASGSQGESARKLVESGGGQRGSSCQLSFHVFDTDVVQAGAQVSLRVIDARETCTWRQRCGSGESGHRGDEDGGVVHRAGARGFGSSSCGIDRTGCGFGSL